MIGKLPPQAIDLEEYVLGAILESSENYLYVADILNSKMFYIEANRVIYECISKMSLDNIPINISSVSSELRKISKIDIIGGAYYLTLLNSKVVGTSSLEYNARIIAQEYVRRGNIKISTEFIQKCSDESIDIFESIDDFESKRDEMMNFIIRNKEVNNLDAISEWMTELKRKSKLSDQDVTGVDTGFYRVNKVTGGWQQSDLIILAARPAMGKTALMLKFALNAARNNNAVLIFSLEMDKGKLINRMISQISEVDIWKIQKPSYMNSQDWVLLDKATKEMESLPIFWDDSASISIMEISAKIKRMKRKENIQFVCIDYLQLIIPNTEKDSRERQIAKIARSLKMTAKEANIPILALSQLSRAVEARADKRPMLSDLRESGAIEQDADLVSFLYRPEYYGITEDFTTKESTEGIAEFIIAKNRNGEVDDVEMNFVKNRTDFVGCANEDVSKQMITDFSFVQSAMTLPSNDMSKYANWDNPKLDDSPF